MNKKCILILKITFCLCLIGTFTGCKKNKEHTHEWNDATCTTPKTCKTCGETSGDALGHSWTKATYDQAKTCQNCGMTEGEPLPFFTYSLNKEYIFLGERARLNIQNYFTFDDLTITYSKPDIINIDNYGQITAIQAGSTSVTIALKSNPKRAFHFSFEVLNEKPILVSNYTKMAVDDVATLYFKNTDGNFSDYEFSFEHNNILELTADYQLKAIGVGNEVITYTLKSDPRITNTLTLSVVDTTSNLLIYSENQNGTMQANAQMQMHNNKNIDNTKLTWISYDKNMAIVSEKGVVTALKEGYASICAKNEVTNEVVEYTIKIEGFANVDYISRILHLAIGENGVHETDKTGSYPCSDNYQKYGEWYHNNGAPWCATFVSWCWHFSGLSTDLLCKYQGCTAGMKWCTEQGIMHYVQDYDFGDIEMENGASPKQYKTDYQPVSGDIVFFLSSGMGHTGIVIYADDTYLYTIEGNTSDQVAVKRWSLNDARITGYASPHYPEYVGEREDFSWIKEQKEDGTYWWKAVSLVEKVD